MKKEHAFIGFMGYIGAVLYLAITTPITPHEATIFYMENEFLSTLMHYGKNISDSFFGIRVFFILFGFLTVYLFYRLSQTYFKKDKDVYLSTLIFMFLPGILTASNLVNIGIIVLPLVILFILLYEKGYFWVLPLIMLLLFFIHQTSMIFFIGVLLFALSKKELKLGILSSAFLLLFVFFEKGIEIGGRPSGHFLEIFGLYTSIFSPLLFIYFFYVMSRILVEGEKSLLWYISFTALIFSLILSIRQRVYVADFAPYVMIAIVLMLDSFNKSLAIRLPQFKKNHQIGFYSVVSVLGVSAVIIIFHQFSFYMLGGVNSKHFAKKIYEPYILAKKLKAEDIYCYDKAKGKERYQLRYYGIENCKK